MALRIGVDIGGTFTDLVALDEATGVVRNTKALSTPRELLDGVLRCVDQAGVRLEDCRLVIHGTTIGINALLEGKGARTGLITTKGFRDVLEIGRGNFLRMYDVLYRRPTPLVPRGRCLEVPERLSARGDVLVPLDEAAVRAAARRLGGRWRRRGGVDLPLLVPQSGARAAGRRDRRRGAARARPSPSRIA